MCIVADAAKDLNAYPGLQPIWVSSWAGASSKVLCRQALEMHTWLRPLLFLAADAAAVSAWPRAACAIQAVTAILEHCPKPEVGTHLLSQLQMTKLPCATIPALRPSLDRPVCQGPVVRQRAAQAVAKALKQDSALDLLRQLAQAPSDDLQVRAAAGMLYLAALCRLHLNRRITPRQHKACSCHCSYCSGRGA